MRNIYEMRNEFTLREYNTAIIRADFEANFIKTKERIRFTFQRLGWKKLRWRKPQQPAVYRTCIKGYEKARFIKVGKGLHYIDEDRSILEKATGEYHKEASWLVDVLRAE